MKVELNTSSSRGDRGFLKWVIGMKNQLQYVYSISVFAGVLLTAYLLLNNEGNARIPLRALQEPTYRTEASFDPAVQQLFQMEKDLEVAKKKNQENQKNWPTRPNP